ncbi:AraC family transcriptional regulator [Parvibaculum sp.]|uniref:helix-turn-helix transcriptional regulator n=1 Tax=Parvibaculum sp. TaxID=2024848 RepID=UPI001AFD4286|nr:AraC family transcriptional regulator [Parvibaculum sp.]MBO6635580.1 helix-turn-helix transcriptional regulator [Parvibaculum sp.]MBO6680376.1 helix-turn-helix transcriptional regulator [Parvibaculum sp.]MBO6685592.1 helix-turn-helix transcriptional regulator [Parvibaculum sp.]MBO6904982.1 helix-turn-helix transcriptional regulator [Parvibaculum sp.]
MTPDDAIAEKDKTSSGLLALVISTLASNAPELLTGTVEMPDCALAHAPAKLKRDLLMRAYEARGADFILGMGQRIKEIGFDPVMHVLLRSAAPEVMAAKFQRFEQFTHSRHRSEIEARDRCLAVRHHAVSGPPPSGPENLLIAGLLKAMLEVLGCEGVSVDAGDAPHDRFALSWQSFQPREVADPLGMAEKRRIEPLRVYGVDETGPLARRVVRLLAEDLGRNWSAGEMARELALSTRTLQRRLSEEGTSLSVIVKAMRVREACQLLTDSDFKITEIGYWCGFSDSPHFSREFRRALGVPPALYRKTAA